MIFNSQKIDRNYFLNQSFKKKKDVLTAMPMKAFLVREVTPCSLV